MSVYPSPLLMQRADPYLLKKDGKYYFTATVPDYDCIELRAAQHIRDLPDAPARILWKKHPLGGMACHIWAPELHYIMGQWVIYFAAGHKPGKWNIRPYTLICKGNDPMKDEWEEGGMLQAAAGDQYPFTDFSLDMTVFEHRGRWYAVWAQKFGTVGAKPPISCLCMAELETPTRLKSPHVVISKPDYDWERRGGFWVNEGPAVLKHGGKIYLTFSASATGACYCMGMLRADEDADLLDPASWKKDREPVFKTDADRRIFGPGHNCFLEGEEGEILTALHFRDYEKIEGDPLNDHNRHAHVMPVQFDEEGAPLFRFPEDALYTVPVRNTGRK